MTESVDQTQSLRAEEVAEYLRENPEFFINHQYLLNDIRLPHESGKAVSLVERQVSVLRERTMDMRKRLDIFIDNARKNDALFDKTRRLVLTLLEARDIGDIIDAIFYSFENEFNIQFTSLILIGNPSSINSGLAQVMALNDMRRCFPRLLPLNKAVCGHLPENELALLFPKNINDIGSAAVAPLVHGQRLGLLAIGNSDPDYYRSSMGTIFLSYIADVLNRVLPDKIPS
ncbi:DUF484 family protein [Marinibactrum halimedae]|uniref:DUF484 family protein n=1 Tax=Marinibactrum halimedae TaxID=1444977 RepID=A0AA37WQE5_9GAMM|nr:DUF484 family protein [Marinibactrum halimedae]MCD9458291.1 DUF484 family protein [Marinibactrum halimedae]GLS27082.1 hypothetical protein GCM10007877_28010 [Marinibactrum halimedae]